MRRTREESRALTRTRLLQIAQRLFCRDGYIATSIDRVADEAGFSKGAVYSNFENKDDLFIAALTVDGEANLQDLYDSLDAADGAEAVIGVIVAWADQRAQGGNWALPILEYMRQSKGDPQALDKQLDMFRNAWRTLGLRILAHCPGVEAEPETLGALVLELVFSPVMALVTRPTPGALIHLALRAILKVDSAPITGGVRKPRGERVRRSVPAR